jgi:hypothetical protein
MFSISTRVETSPQADRDSPPKVVKTLSSPSSSFSGSNRSHPTTSKRSLPGCSTIAYSIPLLIATACATDEPDFHDQDTFGRLTWLAANVQAVVVQIARPNSRPFPTFSHCFLNAEDMSSLPTPK